MSRLTRGPLPPRVYWFRRIMVFGTAVLLVVAIARLLGSGSDGSGGADVAELAADGPSAGSTVTDSGTPLASAGPTLPSTGTAESGAPDKRGKSSKSGRPAQAGEAEQTTEAPVLAPPTGPCVGSDIAVTPEVGAAVGGRDVTITLQLRTISAEACTWRVSPKTLTVNITSGSDDIWSSRDCPRAIARRDVVVRNAVTTEVSLVWQQAKRSGDGCTSDAGWAMPGWYHVAAAALGGEPSDVQFELVKPTAATVTVTATPKNRPSGKPSGKASTKPSGKPSTKPSGAVEPDQVD